MYNRNRATFKKRNDLGTLQTFAIIIDNTYILHRDCI